MCTQSHLLSSDGILLFVKEKITIILFIALRIDNGYQPVSVEIMLKINIEMSPRKDCIHSLTLY